MVKEEVPEGGAGGEVGGELAGEEVEAEAEGAEVGERREDAGGEVTGEGDGREVELDDAGVGGVALDAGPKTRGWDGGVPEEGAAAHGGAQGK